MLIHHLDIDNVVNEWGAFQMTHGGLDLNCETLVQFEQVQAFTVITVFILNICLHQSITSSEI